MKLAGQHHEVLRKVAIPILPEEIADLRMTLFDMVGVMRNATGVGLAATQVGLSRRMAVIEVGFNHRTKTPTSQHQIYKMINPVITKTSMPDEVQMVMEECLSVPRRQGIVIRAAKITVQYLNELGDPKELSADGLLAAVIQHEIDHLDGILFIDRIAMQAKQAEEANKKTGDEAVNEKESLSELKNKLVSSASNLSGAEQSPAAGIELAKMVLRYFQEEDRVRSIITAHVHARSGSSS